MKLIHDVKEMQQTALALKHTGKRIAFVPTMGFLHEGHASLLREGRKRGDCLVLSIFVNPTQFGPNEDLERYPRNLERDCALAEACGVDIIFAPAAAGMYPPGFQTTVSLGPLTEPLCGASRPGHFNGVAVVVAKLFSIVQPDIAFFGKKDFQQLAIIRQMTADLNLPLEIVACRLCGKRTAWPCRRATVTSHRKSGSRLSAFTVRFARCVSYSQRGNVPWNGCWPRPAARLWKHRQQSSIILNCGTPPVLNL